VVQLRLNVLFVVVLVVSTSAAARSQVQHQRLATASTDAPFVAGARASSYFSALAYGATPMMNATTITNSVSSQRQGFQRPSIDGTAWQSTLPAPRLFVFGVGALGLCILAAGLVGVQILRRRRLTTRTALPILLIKWRASAGATLEPSFRTNGNERQRSHGPESDSDILQAGCAAIDELPSIVPSGRLIRR
jgi:hypothetical protein